MWLRSVFQLGTVGFAVQLNSRPEGVHKFRHRVRVVEGKDRCSEGERFGQTLVSVWLPAFAIDGDSSCCC
ncbi:hypothetical protein PC117_g18392 [Phytophthora cactorum]|uniref:Uncharacterized protein n=1 Tax=Phytophthora cactorum TaxID=29920 RepID=A0A8T1C7M1_9STRA|nr:hypothetical protein PC117_g18392 [Phytophthora cactorum]